ncbi:MAG: phosphoribosylamine--glycine ligase [Deltaproteobacteria bacterium]|nr:MAG: phosphoribosylamine--glycine ligase [Deltaproteobacteria bacterium]
MNVLLVGGGGREHALAWRIAQSPTLSALYVTHVNPGFPASATLAAASTVDETVAVAKANHVDLVVVGPEAPLADGLADALIAAGIPTFGPQAAAARLETSKAFAKEIMDAAGVPTAGFLRVDRDDPADVQAAKARCAEGRVAVKVDGLAAGKGVFVCVTADEALAALDEAWSGRFGEAARFLVLEDLMSGPEVSVFGLSDGESVVGLPSAQDHKRIFDGDQGPNTGGMGAYVPCPLLDRDQVEEILERVHRPVVAEMARRGMPFRGVLFAGIMMTPEGARVLEFNVRFGDPETQPLMSLWDEDVLPWLYGAASGELPDGQPAFADEVALCVVLASAGYPETSTKGVAIPEGEVPDGVTVFHAGTRRDEAGVLRTNGGRVLGVTARASSVAEARDKAYAGVEAWSFEGSQHRTDIAHQAL